MRGIHVLTLVDFYRCKKPLDLGGSEINVRPKPLAGKLFAVQEFCLTPEIGAAPLIVERQFYLEVITMFPASA